MGLLHKILECLGLSRSQKTKKEKRPNDRVSMSGTVDGSEIAVRGRLVECAHGNCCSLLRSLEKRVAALEIHQDKVDSRIETFNNRMNYNDREYYRELEHVVYPSRRLNREEDQRP